MAKFRARGHRVDGVDAGSMASRVHRRGALRQKYHFVSGFRNRANLRAD